MAQLFGGQGLDTNQVADADVLPEGEYVVRIVASEVKPTKAGTGMMLIVEMKVEEGPFVNWKLWEQMNVQNQNPTAQQIGQRMLKKLVKATGAPEHITDSNQLHNLPFIAVTKVEEDSYGKKAKLKDAKPYSNMVPQSRPQQQTGQVQQQQTQPLAGAPAAGGMPWQS